MTRYPDDMTELEGLAAGTMNPNAARYITFAVHADGPHEGEPDEGALLAVLHAAGLVSRDVRAVYTEAQAGTAGGAVLHVMDVDTEDTIAFVRIGMGAGA